MDVSSEAVMTAVGSTAVDAVTAAVVSVVVVGRRVVVERVVVGAITNRRCVRYQEETEEVGSTTDNCWYPSLCLYFYSLTWSMSLGHQNACENWDSKLKTLAFPTYFSHPG